MAGDPAARASTSTRCSTTRRPRSSSAAGRGGVGKTTTAAALALRAAERGRSGLRPHDRPGPAARAVDGAQPSSTTTRAGCRRRHAARRAGGGALDAMMLDMKRTFDEIVEQHAEPGRAQAILANPFYQSLSSSFAGTQEYMAMEKLGQLRQRGRRRPPAPWDLIVVDTPPSRSALDFLDAPQRLGSFLDGRFIRMLVAPAKAAGGRTCKVFSAGVGAVTGRAVEGARRPGAHRPADFVAALDTTFGGFRERADATYALLQAPGTAFVVVAAPEPDALREARTSSSGSPRTRCRWPGWCSTGCTARPPASCRPSAAWAPRSSSPTAGSTRSPPGCCGCTPSGCSRSRASGGSYAASPRPSRGCRWPRRRRRPRTCTTSPGCAPWEPRSRAEGGAGSQRQRQRQPQERCYDSGRGRLPGGWRDLVSSAQHQVAPTRIVSIRAVGTTANDTITAKAASDGAFVAAGFAFDLDLGERSAGFGEGARIVCS